MQVVLLERVENLGRIGDVVNVKPGFARNFLLPQSKALRATKANLVRFEAQKEVLIARNNELAAKAEQEGAAINGKDFIVIRKAGETGMLYGSVTARDIAELVGHGVNRNMIILKEPIKALGVTEVSIKLHAEVTVTVTINVARTEDEALRQAEGEDVIATQNEEDRLHAEEVSAERAEITKEMFDGEAPNLGD